MRQDPSGKRNQLFQNSDCGLWAIIYILLQDGKLMERKAVHLKLTVATLSNLGTRYFLTYCRNCADSTKLKCYNCVCDSQSTFPFLSQINPVRIFPNQSFDVYFNVIFRSTLTSPKLLFVFRFRGRRYADVDGRIILKWIFEKRDGGMDWIDLVQDKERLRAAANAVMNLRVAYSTGKFLTGWETVSFSGRTLLHGVS